MAKSKVEWLEALKAYCDAAQRVSELWPDGDVNDYPAYLPSFDEHVQDLRDFLEANTKKAIRTVAQFGDEYNFVSDSQDTAPIKASVAGADAYDAFFVLVGDGDYTEVWGMAGIVPYKSKLASQLV